MLSIPKIIQYVQDETSIDILKSYFERATDYLKTTNKRSNLISQFLLILIVLNFFPGNYTTIKIFEIEFDITIIKILTPTLLSYFIFEWLMVAKRRRDLIVALQQLSYKIYNINPTVEEKYFPGFNANTLNLMPFSIMNEMLSIPTKRVFFKKLITRFTILTIPFALIIFTICSLIQCINSYHLQLKLIWPSSLTDFIELFSLYVCLTVSILFIGWSVFYYITEFENLPFCKRSIAAFKNNEQ